MGKEIEKDCPCTRRCKAKVEDSARIKEFYRFVAENTESMDKYGRWIYGLHPTDEMIEAYISEGSMYFAEENGDISAAVAVTSYQGEDTSLQTCSKVFMAGKAALYSIDELYL